MGREQLAEAEEHSKTVERKAQEEFEMLKVDSMQTPLPASLNILSAIQDAEAARKQIAYLEDWRIKDSDIELVSKIAAGGEGEVWVTVGSVGVGPWGSGTWTWTALRGGWDGGSVRVAENQRLNVIRH